MKQVNFTNSNLTFIVDDDDYSKVKDYIWYMVKGPTGVNYAAANMKYDKRWKLIRVHRFILGLNDSKVIVDHINHDGLDNRKINLRLSNHSLNAVNRIKEPSGAYYNKKDKVWRAKIAKNGKQIHLGTFPDETSARRAYKNKKIELFNFAL